MFERANAIVKKYKEMPSFDDALNKIKEWKAAMSKDPAEYKEPLLEEDQTVSSIWLRGSDGVDEQHDPQGYGVLYRMPFQKGLSFDKKEKVPFSILNEDLLHNFKTDVRFNVRTNGKIDRKTNEWFDANEFELVAFDVPVPTADFKEARIMRLW